MHRGKGFVLAMLLASLSPIVTVGCFGRFALTRKVYAFNRDLSSDRWVRWFGFLIMNFIPVYGAAGAIDLVFANSIEFWGGSNPFAAAHPATRHVLSPQGDLVIVTRIGPDELELRVVDTEGASQTLRVMREPGFVAAYDLAGNLLGRVHDRDLGATIRPHDIPRCCG